MILKHVSKKRKALEKGETSSKLSQNNEQLKNKKKYVGALKHLKNQQIKMDTIFKKLQLKTLDDWLHITPTRIVRNGGEIILKKYGNNLEKLLTNIYPHFAWDFEDEMNYLKRRTFKSLKNQRMFMDGLYKQLQLKTLEGWFEVPRKQIKYNGGKSILEYYENNMLKLLKSLYPNYPWDFERYLQYKNNVKITMMKELKSRKKQRLKIKNQRKKMDSLFAKFQLKTLEDWIYISKSTLILNGAQLLLERYSNNVPLLLRTIYPNYPWDNHLLSKRKEKIFMGRFESIENQRNKFDYLYKKLNLKSFDDWLQISPSAIIRSGGGWLFKRYQNNFNQLLSTLYPNYPWQFATEEINHRKKFKSMKSQREFMDQLFISLNLKSMDDWLLINRHKLRQFGARNLLDYYDNNLLNLLTNVYPNYPWTRGNDDVDFIDTPAYLKSLNASMISIYRKRMDELFVTLKLNKIEEWIGVAQWILIQNIDAKLFSSFQHHFEVLSILYPNFPWSSLKSSFILHKDQSSITSSDYRAKYITHEEYMEELFTKFQLKTLNDWLNITRSQIGKRLLKYYNHHLSSLFTSIYPNYPWDFVRYSYEFNGKMFKSIDQQREYMESLFHELQLNTLDEWITVYRFHSKLNNKLKNNTQNNRKIIRSSLSTLYPNYPWNFSTSISKLLLENKIKDYISKYYICQKKDWYRVSCRKYQLIEMLKIFYPLEKWNNSQFQLRSKKSAQRLLFASVRDIYPSLMLLENYFHPKLMHSSHYELDLFIPALQLALEYQGEQHYDDLPSAFAGTEFCQFRDQLKEKIAADLAITIVHIPYWWDQSLSSLYSSLKITVM